MTRYYIVEQGQNTDGKRSNEMAGLNPFFDGLTYNTRGYFAHCSYFPRPHRTRKNITHQAKYPRVVKQSNMVYLRNGEIANAKINETMSARKPHRRALVLPGHKRRINETRCQLMRKGLKLLTRNKNFVY